MKQTLEHIKVLMSEYDIGSTQKDWCDKFLDAIKSIEQEKPVVDVEAIIEDAIDTMDMSDDGKTVYEAIYPWPLREVLEEHLTPVVKQEKPVVDVDYKNVCHCEYAETAICGNCDMIRKSFIPKEVVREEEMNNRDFILANIYNTTAKKSDMFLEITDYLVTKWFLQKWVNEKPTPK